MKPVERVDGHPLLEDLGLIGDGRTAALVGRDGCVEWLCAPTFDSPPILCGLLDDDRGGCFRIAPDRLRASRHRYEGDTPILVTEMMGPDGTLRVTDLMTLRSGADLTEDAVAARGELLRIVEVTTGRVRVVIDIEARGAEITDGTGRGLSFRSPGRPDLGLHMGSDRPLHGKRTTIDLAEGDRMSVILRWGSSGPHGDHPDPDDLVAATRTAWERWMEGVVHKGPGAEQVRRSAMVLKLLDDFGTGGLVAAPTSSLPEHVGGDRNWDYRYAWVRDAAFTVHAFRRIGLAHESRSFLGWILDIAEDDDPRRVMHTVSGGRVPDEVVDPDLRGYRGSHPVRWGNAARDQRQNDVFGEFIDCAWQWARESGELDEQVRERLWRHADAAARVWTEPDAGIWEVRSAPRRFTYSAGLCHVALDRAARLAEQFGPRDRVTGWRDEAGRIQRAIIEQSWDERRGAFMDCLGGSGERALDAAVLTLPLRHVLDARHPRMASTIDRIADELGAGNGLVYRYNPDEFEDGVEGGEGAFLLCSFWLVDCLAALGRTDEAGDLFASLCDRASPLGLLPEQVDPTTGGFVGNFPQAFTHLGLIASSIILGRAG
jgi:alpha,alpha-trehalase